MASVATRIAQRESVRTAALSCYRMLARTVVLLPPPRVFANSLPKAGTHLLSALLRRLPRMMFAGNHHVPQDFQETPFHPVDYECFRGVLGRVPNGQFVTAHWPDAAVARVLEELGYRPLLILRDPRDVVVSHAFYVTRLERHHLHRRYAHHLRDMDERIMASITGFEDDERGPGLHPVGERLARYFGWLDDPSTYVCRFEDLIGPGGGGSIEAQRREIAAVAGHCGRPLSAKQVEALAQRLWSAGGPTFRKGHIGDWRNNLSEAHKAEFKRLAGEELVHLGYARDTSW